MTLRPSAEALLAALPRPAPRSIVAEVHRRVRQHEQLLDACREALLYLDALEGSPRLLPIGRANLHALLRGALSGEPDKIVQPLEDIVP